MIAVYAMMLLGFSFLIIDFFLKRLKLPKKVETAPVTQVEKNYFRADVKFINGEVLQIKAYDRSTDKHYHRFITDTGSITIKISEVKYIISSLDKL